MRVQIFGKSKCFDTKKAERYFKERRIDIQMIDLARFGMSRGEMQSVLQAVGGVDALLDPKAKGAELVRYMAYEQDKIDRLLEQPQLIRTPVVRWGKKATLGYCPEEWKNWQE